MLKFIYSKQFKQLLYSFVLFLTQFLFFYKTIYKAKHLGNIYIDEHYRDKKKSSCFYKKPVSIIFLMPECGI